MIRSCLGASARGCARHLSINHRIEEAGIAEARRWNQEADQLRASADLELLSPRQRAALADHRAVWCLEVVG